MGFLSDYFVPTLLVFIAAGCGAGGGQVPNKKSPADCMFDGRFWLTAQAGVDIG
jgi:hypothetical protein